MKDDYLWDGTGEPDPDIQQLEQTLSRFRYQPEPLKRAFDQQFPARRANWWPKLAAAAAIVLMALVGLWIVRNQNRSDAQQPIAGTPGGIERVTPQPDAQKQIPAQPSATRPEESITRDSATGMNGKLARVRKPVRKDATVASKDAHTKPFEPERFDPAPRASEVAMVQPIVIPFVDIETSKHIERAQMLLRSFRNMDDADNERDAGIAYEKQQSRGLLYQNIVLRRDAEAKGNMPVEDLLGSLEPFLIDIANLPEKPSKDDVTAIKERMQKKEIVSALQIYSAPTLSQVFN
jgi:hypothetical protein